MNQKLHNATHLYLEGIAQGHPREAVTKYTGRRYTQHSTGVRNGIDGFVEFFEPFIIRCPKREIQIVRSLVDEPYVFVQAFQNINDGEAKWVTMDLFDTDDNDKIVEHWDVIAPFEAEDQINGPTEPDSRSDTEANKDTVRNFLCDVMVLGQSALYGNYVKQDTFIMHAGSDVEAFERYIGSYDQVVKIIGQGDTVVAYSRVVHNNQAFARFDLFRVRDGKIVELWVNHEPVLPKSEWVNGGKF